MGKETSLLAGVVQMTSGGDLEANLAKASELIVKAARRGAELAVLPENFAILGDHEQAKFAVAERLPGDGPILGRMRELARKHKIALVLGGMPEQVSSEAGVRLDTASAEATRLAPLGSPATHVHNTCVYLDQDGEIGGLYRKIHLFDVAIPDGAEYRESATVAPGAQPVRVETPWGGLGLSVCYDVRFPELYRALAALDVRMLVVPAAFTLHTGRAHWHVLLRARAIENLAFVLAAAQYGKHNVTPSGAARRVTYGHSLVVDPWGQVLAELGDREGVAVAELDLAYQDQVRRELPALGHRRLP